MTSSTLQAVTPSSLPGGGDAATQIVEARADPRVAVDLPVQLHGADFLAPLPGQAHDIGVGGLCVATRSMFAFRSLRSVALLMPQGPLSLAIEGRWQAHSPSEQVFLTGMAFVEPEPSAVAALWDVVQGASDALGRFLYQHCELRAGGVDDAMGIAQISRLRRVPAGRSIYGQDSSAPGDDSIFILREGTVTLHFRFGPADEVTLDRLGPGSVFGGLPIVAQVPNLERAFAREHCTLLEVSRTAHTRLRLAKPLLAQRLTQIAARCHALRVRRLLELASLRRR